MKIFSSYAACHSLCELKVVSSDFLSLPSRKLYHENEASFPTERRGASRGKFNVLGYGNRQSSVFNRNSEYMYNMQPISKF